VEGFLWEKRGGGGEWIIGCASAGMSRPEFAFLIEKLSTRAEVVHFIAKRRITGFFLNCFGLIYLAIYPPSIITANVRPPSASTDFFNFSETRACSLGVAGLRG